jgi:mannonate dehydratase
MRLSLGLGGKDTASRLKYMQQIGVDSALLAPPCDPEVGYYEFPVLMDLKAQVEAAGLKVDGTSLIPWQLCYKWMLGLPDRDEQIEKFMTTLRNMGAAGYPLIIYNMHAIRFYRTNRAVADRGGAGGSSFELERVKNSPLMSSPGINMSLIPEEHRKPVSDEQMWANLEYFLKAVVPVAEEAGVQLALHPDDPPVPEISGVARIMREPEAFQKAIDLVPSDYNGLKFCVGCFSEMGADVAKWIRHFGAQKKLFFIDFRNIRGDITCFNETFPDDGNENMYENFRAIYESGYEGAVHPDHAMKMDGDTDARQYWSFAIGHMRGYLEALETEKNRK